MFYVHKDDLGQLEEQGYYDNTVYVSNPIPLVLDLNTGEEVPADGTLLEAISLQINHLTNKPTFLGRQAYGLFD